MPKTKMKPVIRRKVKITPIAVLFVADDLGVCTLSQLMDELKSQLGLKESEFQLAVDYEFVPSRVTPLLESGWLLRKWDGEQYTFRVTAAGKSELEKH